jgi:hypothetical protein
MGAQRFSQWPRKTSHGGSVTLFQPLPSLDQRHAGRLDASSGRLNGVQMVLAFPVQRIMAALPQDDFLGDAARRLIEPPHMSRNRFPVRATPGLKAQK